MLRLSLRRRVHSCAAACVRPPGLTCTDQTFLMKGNALSAAARYGIMLVCPDTSPRPCARRDCRASAALLICVLVRAAGGVHVAGDSDSWDLGLGAGFYVDATAEPWRSHYRMYSYVTDELPAVVCAHLPARPDAQSIFGHSMGGHGALVCALRQPGRYRSVSAFAPICHPSQCPWGRKAFTAYLGPDESAWAAYDACELAQHYEGPAMQVKVDQGMADKYLAEGQLRTDDLPAALARLGHPISLELRRHEGYDHSYYFISTFIEQHMAYHARHLGCTPRG